MTSKKHNEQAETIYISSRIKDMAEKLSIRIACSVPEAVGHLTLLTIFASCGCKRKDISDISHRDIARFAMYETNDHFAFISALIDVGAIEETTDNDGDGVLILVGAA